MLALGAVCWGLLVFGGPEDSTVVYIGSYLLPILGIAGAVAGLRSVLPRFAVWFVSTYAALSLILYVPSFEPQPGTSYSVLAAILAVLALTGYALVAFGVRRPPLPRALGRLAQTS